MDADLFRAGPVLSVLQGERSTGVRATVPIRVLPRPSAIGQRRRSCAALPVGQGHVVSFAIRPYWRWQTQGTFFLGFNTILNWNDLDAGKATGRATTTQRIRGP